MSDKVRVLRILEYVGDREWVEDALKRCEIPLDGCKDFKKESVVLLTMLDQFPEILEKLENE